MTGPRRPGMMPMGAPGDKARSFGPSIRRIVRLLSGYRVLMPTILLSLTCSVILLAIAPRVLGHATDLVFNGVIGKVLPAGQTKAEAVAGLRERGQDTFADMVSSMDVTPGQGIDFGAVGRILLIVLGLYLVSMTMAWLASYLLNIVVVATIVEPNGGSAMIQDETGNVMVVQVGDEFQAGGTTAKLIQVYPDRIEMEHAGKVLTVSLKVN